MAWKKYSTINKMMSFVLNSENDYTLDLKKYGEWNYDKVDFFVMIKKINMSLVDKGYNLNPERVGDGIYRCNPTTSVLSYRSERTQYHDFNTSRSKTFDIEDDSAFFFITAIAQTNPEGNISLTAEVNDEVVYTKTPLHYYDTSVSLAYGNRVVGKDTTVTINCYGNMINLPHPEDSNKVTLKEYKYKESSLDTEICVLAIEGD